MNDDLMHRIIGLLCHYNTAAKKASFSRSLAIEHNLESEILKDRESAIVKILSYCIMPDHYHILVKLTEGALLSKYISDVENGFTRYFNLKFNRKGPLWQSRFKSVLITNEKHMLHVSRYIHLNPTSANLVKKPEDWKFSSYRALISDKSILKNFLVEFPIGRTKSYKSFVEGNIKYQRTLKQIRKLLIDCKD